MTNKSLEIAEFDENFNAMEKLDDCTHQWIYSIAEHRLFFTKEFFYQISESEVNTVGLLKDYICSDSKYTYEQFTKHLRENRLINCILHITTRTGVKTVLFASIKHADEKIHGLLMTTNALEVASQVDQQTPEAAKFLAVGKIAGSIAHEINNPLSIIRMNAEILMTSNSLLQQPAKIKEKCQKIISTTDRMSSIVRALRSISASTKKSNFTWVNFNDLMDDLLELCSLKLKEDKVSVHCDFSNVSHQTYYLDHAQVTQALINLINNACDAIKSMDEKWIKLAACTDSQYLIIKIIDSGHGIPDNIVHQMTNELFSTKGSQGLGLGLSLVKAYLNSHEGKLGYMLVDNHTCFYISLPLTQVQPKTC